nr:hypothetical protein [Clostridia bacterium]
MKKSYEPPTVELIAFSYRDQVVAASGANEDQVLLGTVHEKMCHGPNP